MSCCAALKPAEEILRAGCWRPSTAEAYREGVLTSAEVGRTLGHTSRAQTEAFLKQARAPLGCTVEDLQRDTDTLHDLLGT